MNISLRTFKLSKKHGAPIRMKHCTKKIFTAPCFFSNNSRRHFDLTIIETSLGDKNSDMILRSILCANFLYVMIYY